MRGIKLYECSASLPKLFSAVPAEPAEGDAKVDDMGLSLRRSHTPREVEQIYFNC